MSNTKIGKQDVGDPGEKGEKSMAFGEHKVQKKGHTKGKSFGNGSAMGAKTKFSSGGKVASARGDGVAQRGKTKGRMC